MDERHHSAFTGTRATVDPWVGGRVVSDDGFIDATHVYLVTGSRIAMTWRTRDFPKGSNDSHVDISFEPVAGGTKVEVTHSKIPPGLGKACEKLWKKLYLDPMTKYFGEPEAMRIAYICRSPASRRVGPRPGAPSFLLLNFRSRISRKTKRKRRSLRRPASGSRPRRSTSGSSRGPKPRRARKLPKGKPRRRRRPTRRSARPRPLRRRPKRRRRRSYSGSKKRKPSVRLQRRRKPISRRRRLLPRRRLK
ncbi:MAG: SRPBCC domain-containing protein, partial [Deltaproteobacteria bacterium]|nr:SRPBCC domain-containing protein [Deltaproteobacteria bacterium]